jgi:predicted transposase/invertase (TIGR01784 family)
VTRNIGQHLRLAVGVRARCKLFRVQASIFMRRDTIFYQLFLQSPTLLFDLIPNRPENASEYVFDSIEVKETSFRIDGVFLPPDRSSIIYFAEVQFQLDELLYERMLSEISIFAYRHRQRFFDWQAVVIYPSRSVEQSKRELVREFLASGRIVRVYLDELGTGAELPIGLGLMVLTTLEGEAAKTEAKRLIAVAQGSKAIIEIVSTIIVYKFINLTRDEVDAMLEITLQQTRVYQDAKAEGELIGEARGEAKVIMRQLNRRLGSVPVPVSDQIQQLTIPRLEDLGEALLDFTGLEDLEGWLSRNSQ